MPQASGTVHKLPLAKAVRSRADFILERCRGKRVLHLGCVESGTVEESFRNGSLLHLRLRSVAKQVIGLDVDGAGLAFLREQGIPDLMQWNVERLEELYLDALVEVIVAGEVLEHLANPGLCLRGMRKMTTAADAIAIITVPNAFSLRTFLPVALTRTELVMPDHTAYFSPTTLTELLKRCGWSIRELKTYSNLSPVSGPTKRLVKRAIHTTLFRLNPFLAEGIIAVAEKA